MDRIQSSGKGELRERGKSKIENTRYKV